MQNLHHAGRLGKAELQAIVAGRKEHEIDDMEFFETLAQRRCVVMPPWVYRVDASGHLEQVTPVRYTPDYHLDKASMLLAVMEKLRRGEEEEGARSRGGREMRQ